MATATVTVQRTEVDVTTPGPQGPPGVSGPLFVLSAAALSSFRAVDWDAAGKVLEFDPAALTRELLGVARTSASAADEQVEVVTHGLVVAVGAGLSPGARYFATSGGVLSTTPPASGRVQTVGTAKDADTLQVDLGDEVEAL